MKLFYNIVSIVFQPLLMPTFGMILLTQMDIFLIFPLAWKWIAIGGTFVFTGILPAVPILLMIRRGEVKDLFISDRRERNMPYLFSLIAYIFWVLFMHKNLQFPFFIVAMGIGATCSILVILLINTRWKISAHLSGIGGLTGAIFAIAYRTAINPYEIMILTLIISALVAVARIELKAHTPGQVLAGFAVGFLMIFMPSVFI